MQGNRIRVLVVAGTRLLRDSLAALLSRAPGLLVAGLAAGGVDAAALDLARLDPDVIVLDVASTDSRRAARQLRSAAPRIPIVALGVADHESEIVSLAEAGVAGYAPPEADVNDLVLAISGAARGENACPPQIAEAIERRLSSLAESASPSRPDEPGLTLREKEVLALIEIGYSNKSIGRQLGIELSTVKNHVHNLLDKLGVHRRYDAARLLSSPTSGRAPSSEPSPEPSGDGPASS
jgi:two-component system nitrate/nitrite response regulator NarL